ncbi:hypothetical protein RIF29_37598 [Crotalaria pallida]|uniref:PHD-type domain-containing protein n=1 Tax=Crotalaria pallida TaxID=3830 RepID=A0AAN9EJ54_CROPI
MLRDNRISAESGKKFVKHFTIQTADMRLESGTCNVCSAPCSSCMHLNHALKEPKAEEISDENCRVEEANNQCSMDEGNVSSLGSRACEGLQHAISETSNILSVTSSHNSLSENAESGQTLSNKYLDSKSLEGLDDNTSCISRTSDTYLVNKSHKRNDSMINISCNSASVGHLGAEGSGSAPSVYKTEIPSSKDVDSSHSLPKVSPKVCPKSEVDSDNDARDVKDEDRNVSVHDALHEKAEELDKSTDMQEPQSEHESDKSDLVVEDVQLCDICGDAGREEQLAICSRCSDGAEHIYCMRVMLQKVPEGDWLCEECKYAEETENQKLVKSEDVEDKKTLKVSSTSQVSGKRISENIEVAPAAKRQALESSTGSPKMSSPKKLAQLSRESSFKSLDKGKVKPIHYQSGGGDKEIARSLSIGPRGQISKSTLLKSSSFNNINSKPRVKLVDEIAPPKPKRGGEHTSKSTEMPARMTSKSASFKSQSVGRSNATESKVKMLSPKSATAQELKGSRHSKESGSFDRKLPSRIDRPVASSSMVSSVVSTPKGDQKLTPRGETIKSSAANNTRELRTNQDGKFSTLSKSTSNISRKSLEPQVNSETTSTSVDEALQNMLPQSREIANQDEKTRDGSRDRLTTVVTTSKVPFCKKCKEFDHSPESCTAGSTQESGAEVCVTALSSSKEEMHRGNKLKAAIHAALRRRPEIYKKKEVPSQTDDLSTSGTDQNCLITLQDQVLLSSTLKNSTSADETHEQQDIPEDSTSDSSKCSSASDLKLLNSCPMGFCYQPGRSDSVVLAVGKPVVKDLSRKALAISSILSMMPSIPEYEYIWQGIFEVHRNGKPPDLCTGIQAHLSSCASPKVLEVVNKFLPKVPLNEVSRLSSWPSQFHQGGATEYNIALYFFAKDIESYERHYKGLLDHMIRNDLALKGIFDGVELLIFPSNQLPESAQRWNMLFFLWGVFRGRRTDHLDSAKKICIPSLNPVPIEEDPSTAVGTLSEMHCLPKPVDEVSIARDKACSEYPPSTFRDQGQISISRNIGINDPTHLGSQGNLEKQASRINSKSALAVPTSSTLLHKEMKSTDSSLKDSVLEHGQCKESNPLEAPGSSLSRRSVETKSDCDISVNQGNTEISSVGNQERGDTSNIGRDKISERMNSDEDQQRPERQHKENCCYIDLEAAIDNQDGGAASNICKYKDLERMDRDEDQQSPKKKQKDDCCIDLEVTIADQEGAVSHINMDKISERMNRDEDQRRPKRKQKDDHYIDLEATDIDLEATFQGDQTVEWVNCQPPNDKVVRHVDLSHTVMPTSAISYQKVPQSGVNGKSEDGGSYSKKLKMGFGGIYGSCSSGGRDSLNDNFASLANDFGSRSSVEDKGCEEACDEKIICEDLGTTERTFFPVCGSQLDLNSMSSKGPHEYLDGFPNLELALGGKNEPPPPQKGMLPFLVRAVDKKNSQEKHPDVSTVGQEEDVGAASLSLSLAFPSSKKEHKKAASKAEPLPDGHRGNTPPFLLFGRFTDK